MLFLLDKTSQTSRWNGLPLHEASSAVVSETLNGDFKLTMSYPLSDTLVYQLLETDKLIKSPAPLLGQQLFRIREVVEGDDAVEVVAYHITDDIMRRSIKPLALHQVGCQIALSQVVIKSKSSLAPFSLSSDIASLHTFHTDKTETLYSILLDGKHSIVGTWEGELVRDNFSLAIKARRGEDRGVVISTHKNLKRYERKQGSQSVITRIHLRSTIKEGEDDRVLSLTLDSPLIHHYPYIQEAEFENNNLKTLDELRQWGEAKFRYENIDKPSDAITIEAYELDGQAVHLGDWVRLKSRKHQIDLSKQAIGYEYNALTKTYISLTFDDRASLGGSSMSSPFSSFAKEVLSAADTAQEFAIKEAVENANRAFETTFEKEKEALEAGIEVAKSKVEVVRVELGQVINQVEGRAMLLEQDLRATDQKANQILNDLGLVRNLGELAKREADEAKNQARQAVQSALDKATQLDSELTVTKERLIQQTQELVQQARRQEGLVSRLETIERTESGTRISLATLTGTVNQATDTLTNLNQRVSSTETTLTGIRQDYHQLTQTLGTTGAEIRSLSQQTASLESGLNGINNRFENLQVGGVNLLTHTRDFAGSSWVDKTYWQVETDTYRGLSVLSHSRAWYGVYQAVAVEAGKTYTFSLYVKREQEGTVRTYIVREGWSTASVSSITKLFTVGQAFERISHTFLATRSGLIHPRLETPDTAKVYICGYQLEEGSFATSYQEQVADVRQDIAQLSQSVTEQRALLSQELESLTGQLSRTSTLATQTASQLSQKAEQALVDRLTGRVSSAESNINQQATAISQRLTSTQVEAAIPISNS